MPALVNYGGEIHPKFLSTNSHINIYCAPRKKARITAPVASGREAESEKQTSINILPDECMFEIFRRLSGGKERSVCTSVSKRWLWILGSISKNEIVMNKSDLKNAPGQSVPPSEEKEDLEPDGFLTRSLEGKKATDIRLAAIAVGTSSRGGLGKLMIRSSNSNLRVTDAGLAAIACGCPSLKVLSLWDSSGIGDKGLAAIGNGCLMLEKLDLFNCPLLSDKGLITVAQNCPNLTSISIESCSNIGNFGILEIARCCPNLSSVEIKDCPLVGDQGIADLIIRSPSLAKVKLQSLNISDTSLAVIGFYGRSLTDLTLINLHNVTERGFWVLGAADGLHNLKCFAIAACQGVTDLGLEAIGKSCLCLKQFHLSKCSAVSDQGLKSFSRFAVSLENLHLEECNGISQAGILGSLNSYGTKFKSLALVKCMGIRQNFTDVSEIRPCSSLRSLAIMNCPGFGSAGLAMVGKLCPKLRSLDLEGTYGVTDTGLLTLLESCQLGLAKVNLKGCINLSDSVISSLCRLHGRTLEHLNLDGCRKITDQSLIAIADNCSLITELYVSKSGVTDIGLAALASQKWLDLQIFSLSGCPKITDKCVTFLSDLGRSLVGLNLMQCPSINGKSIELLVNELWKCDILY